MMKTFRRPSSGALFAVENAQHARRPHSSLIFHVLCGQSALRFALASPCKPLHANLAANDCLRLRALNLECHQLSSGADVRLSTYLPEASSRRETLLNTPHPITTRTIMVSPCIGSVTMPRTTRKALKTQNITGLKVQVLLRGSRAFPRLRSMKTPRTVSRKKEYSEIPARH